MAEVGLVPGSQHFRNIRHSVETYPLVLTLRIDKSLWFTNARVLKDRILNRVMRDGDLRDVVLMCPAVNEIDLSTLGTLESLNHRLHDMGLRLHLSEVKGPLTDRLRHSDFLEDLSGAVFLSQYDA